MANVVISGCTSGPSFTVVFTGTTPSAGQVYNLNFTGVTTDGCYVILPDEPGVVIDGVQTSILFANCSECNSPNVLLRNCVTGEENVAPRKNANIGDFFSATASTTTNCYEVISYTSTSSSFGLDTEYTDCLDCYKNEFTGVVFSSCTNNEDIVVLTASTSTLTFTPNANSTYYMTFSGVSLQYEGCFNFVRFTNASNQYRITNVDGEYPSCYGCGVVNIPTSAGTTYYVCVICNGTATTVNPPHPIYSNLYGQDVTQLNAVQLGGTYGLYN